MILLHTVPCVSFLCVLVEVLIVGVLQPDSIQRHPLGMYCHLTVSTAPKITAGLSIIAMAAFLCLEGAIGLTLWRLWRSSGKLTPLRTQDHISIDVAARVVIFGFCPMIAIGVSAVSIPKLSVDDNKTTLIQAALPVTASLIFGTQRDILLAWMFWRRRESPRSPIHKV